MKQLKVLSGKKFSPFPFFKKGQMPDEEETTSDAKYSVPLPINETIVHALDAPAIIYWRTLFERSATEKLMSIKDITTIQEYVYQTGFNDYVRLLQKGKQLKPSYILTINKINLLFDGTHRLCARWAVGATKVPILHLQFDNVPLKQLKRMAQIDSSSVVKELKKYRVL